jgi:hypothetical protein
MESRVSKPVVASKEVSNDTIKRLIEEQKASKIAQLEKREKAVGGSVKTFIPPVKLDDQPKMWGATPLVYQSVDERVSQDMANVPDEPQEDPEYPKLLPHE